MAFRDRFFTPTTARAILSWRILLGLGVGVGVGLAGAPIGIAAGVGAALYAVSVGASMPRAPRRPQIDPFTLGEPWRQIVQRAQGSGRKLRQTVAGTSDGPLRRTLDDIVDQLEHGLDEAWEIAKRGDEIDDAIRRLDPTALRAKLATLQARATGTPEDDAAIASVERQLSTADRLTRLSEETATTLRLTQTQLDELAARATEVRIGAIDTTAYRRDVDDLVIRLEALHQAVEETRTS